MPIKTPPKITFLVKYYELPPGQMTWLPEIKQTYITCLKNMFDQAWEDYEKQITNGNKLVIKEYVKI